MDMQPQNQMNNPVSTTGNTTPAPSRSDRWRTLSVVLVVLVVGLLAAFVYSVSQQYRLLNRVIYLQNQLEFIVNNESQALDALPSDAGVSDNMDTTEDSVPELEVTGFDDLSVGEAYNFIQGTTTLSGEYLYCGFFDGNDLVVTPPATCEAADTNSTLYVTDQVVVKLLPGVDEVVLEELGTVFDIETTPPGDDLVPGSTSTGVPEYILDVSNSPYDAYQVAQIYYASEQVEYAYPVFESISALE